MWSRNSALRAREPTPRPEEFVQHPPAPARKSEREGKSPTYALLPRRSGQSAGDDRRTPNRDVRCRPGSTGRHGSNRTVWRSPCVARNSRLRSQAATETARTANASESDTRQVSCNFPTPRQRHLRWGLSMIAALKWWVFVLASALAARV